MKSHTFLGYWADAGLAALTLTLLSLLAMPAGAGSPSDSMPGLADGHARDRISEFDVLPTSDLSLSLSLRDAVTQALGNHPELKAAWYAGEAEAADGESYRSRFDVTLTGGMAVPVATETMVYAKELGYLSLGKQYSTGTRLSAEYHLERDPDGLFVSANGDTRLYRHRFGLRLAQPLGKDRGSGATMAAIRAEESEFLAAEAGYRRFSQEVVFSVENAYWRLHAAQLIETVYKEALEAAERLLRLSSAQYQAGELSRLELTVARAGVASRREDVILARINADKSRDRLLALLLGSSSPSRLSSQVTLLTPPDTTNTAAVQLPTLGDVLQRRPDYSAAQHLVKSSDQRILAARNEHRERIDLIMEGGYASLGSQLGTQYQDPISGHDISGPYVFVGCEVAFSLPGHGKQGAEHRAAATREASHWSREAVTRSIVLDIRQAQLDLESSLERVRVTRTAGAAVQEQLRGEREKFAMGQTTNQSALLSENELRSARVREIRAMADLQVARARLRLAVGTTLDHFDLTLE